MSNEGLLIARLIFGLLFLATLAIGGWLLKNHQRLFGADAAMPSENGSARAYSQVQVYSIWLHAAFLFGAFTLLFS